MLLRRAGVSLHSVPRPQRHLRGHPHAPRTHRLSKASRMTKIPLYLWQPGDLDEPLEIQHVGCFLKEVFEAGEGEKKNRSQGRQRGLAGGRGPQCPTSAPGYLRNCSLKRSRWPCSVSAGRPAARGGTAVTDTGLQIYSQAPTSLRLQKPAGKGQVGVGYERSGWEQDVPIPGIRTRDMAQGEAGVGIPKYPRETPGAALPSNTMQGAVRPRYISLNSSRTRPSSSLIWDVYVGWSGCLEPGWDTATWRWMSPSTQASSPNPAKSLTREKTSAGHIPRDSQECSLNINLTA